MKSQKISSEATQGTDSELPTLENVEKYLKTDLGMCRSFLQAIHDDPNILRLIAIHIHGKYENHLNAKRNGTKPEN